MSSASEGGGGQVCTCPLCQDYKGEPPSVEAHISRSTDPVHRGEVGRGHRADLERQVEEQGESERTEPEPENMVTAEEYAEQHEEQPSEGADEESHQEVQQDGSEPAAGAAEAGAVTAAAGGAGLLARLDDKKMMLALLGLVIVAWVVMSGSESESENSGPVEDSGESSSNGQEEGGLV